MCYSNLFGSSMLLKEYLYDSIKNNAGRSFNTSIHNVFGEKHIEVSFRRLVARVEVCSLILIIMLHNRICGFLTSA